MGNIMENANIMEYETVALDDEAGAVVIIDQTLLPSRTELIRLKTAQEIWDAIYLLKVRGRLQSGWLRLLEFMCWQNRQTRMIMMFFTGNLQSRRII